jgi:ABC-2 type transport system ATP-binding protein
MVYHDADGAAGYGEPAAGEQPEVAFLSVSGASFSFGDLTVLDGLDLDVARGEVFVLLGPNGAGKSTLVRAIAGRLALTEGVISIGGSDPLRSARARRACGFVPQRVALYEQLTVEENLRVIGQIMGLRGSLAASRAKTVARAIGLAERAGDRAAVLSGGMRRRLNIGMALVHGPRLLVLDEPTAGVDVAGRRALVSLILRLRDQGLAILLTTHDMEEAEALADQVGIIIDGRIQASGTPRELIAHLFGTSKELVASVGPRGIEDGSSAHFTLMRNGFRPDARGDAWRVLVQWSDADIADFIEHILSSEPVLKELRVRRPGLDTVLAHFTRKRPAR